MAATAPRKTSPPRKRATKAAPPTVANPSNNEAAILTEDDRAWIGRHEQLASDPEPAVQAETATEELPDGAIAVPLGPHGDIVHVLPRRDWRSSDLSALHQGNLELWASRCIHQPDYETIWVGLDPTLGEVEEMLGVWQELTGEDVGKAPVRRGSLRNGRKR